MSTYEIGNTIYQQLGGHQFGSITGARNFAHAKDDAKNMAYLSFGLPSSITKDRVRYVKILLNEGTDTYEIEFGRVKNGAYEVIAYVDAVYADQLLDVFETHTGLYATLSART